ncbi:SDR family NAD(P)-dependent oxidoreductase [Tianweitania sediminis]|nr:SDR family oxidoreductase [Tianweitania sediminis]
MAEDYLAAYSGRSGSGNKDVRIARARCELFVEVIGVAICLRRQQLRQSTPSGEKMIIEPRTRVIVTGGASGIGLAVTKACLERGAQVAVNALPGDAKASEVIAGLKATYNETVVSAFADVSDRGAVEDMITSSARQLGGKVDLLVNNAGTSNTRDPIPMSDLDKMTPEFWGAIFSTNLLGPFWCSRAAAPYFSDGGAIINIASIAGLGKSASSMAYAASKAALINMTINLAKALAPHVRVNAVAPGLTRTPWTADWPEARVSKSLSSTLLGRWVEAEDVAHAVIMLAENPSITAQTLVVDAGRGYHE